MLLPIHIAAGGLAIILGAVALSVNKGGNALAKDANSGKQTKKPAKAEASQLSADEEVSQHEESRK